MANAVRDVFVAFAPEQGKPTAAAYYAASLARAHNALLTARALGVKIWQPYGLFPSVAAGYVSAANDATKERIDQSASALASELVGLPLSTSIASMMGTQPELAAAVSLQARLHDLAVTDLSLALFGEGRAMIDELLFAAGRPTIVVPPGVVRFSAKTIVAAWDGGACAARAINDAMPLLAAAEKAQLVCIVNEKDLARAVPGAEFAPHLDRHGVKVELVDLSPAHRDAGRAIRDHAKAVGADMIVMGAFGHSRLRQLVLGGVTEAMLRETPAPVFFSH